MILSDIVKILLAKETCDVLSEAFQVLSKSTAWKADLLAMDEAFSRSDKDKSLVLISFIYKILGDKGWARDRVSIVEFATRGLVEITFLHGVGDAPRGKVRLRASVTSEWCQLRVTDSGHGFDLQTKFQVQLASRTADELRGLAQVYHTVTELSQEDPKTLVLWVQRAQGRFKPLRHGDIDVVVFEGANSRRYLQHQTFLNLQRTMETLAAGTKVAFDLTSVTR